MLQSIFESASVCSIHRLISAAMWNTQHRCSFRFIEQFKIQLRFINRLFHNKSSAFYFSQNLLKTFWSILDKDSSFLSVRLFSSIILSSEDAMSFAMFMRRHSSIELQFLSWSNSHKNNMKVLRSIFSWTKHKDQSLMIVKLL